MADGNVAAEQLRLFIERIERLTDEKKGIADDIRDVYAEAKGSGFDGKTIREIIKLRAMEPDARREREALLDTYKAALGMLDGTPLGKWAIERLEKSTQEEAESKDHHAEELYVNAARMVIQHKKASTSWLQRTLRLGHSQAAELLERMEREDIVSAPDAKGVRKILTETALEPAARPRPPQTAAEPEPAPPPPPEATIDEARQMGTQAAHDNKPVTANPFPARDPRRAAWDEAWCAALGSDGMDIPSALRPTPKAKKAEPEGKPGEGSGE